MPTIKGKLGGFNKKEVDEHIRKIKKAQDSELEDLSNKIEVCQWEAEILKQELDSLKQKERSLPDQGLLEFAINKLDKVLGFMDQDVTIDVLAIDKITQQKVGVLENSIGELDKDIEKEKEIIEKELKNIAEIAKGQDRAKNINIEVIKSFGKVLPIADWLKSNREEQANQDKEFWGEEPKSQKQESSNQMTSDGMSLSSSTTPTINPSSIDAIRLDKSNEDQVSDVVKGSAQENEDNDLEELSELVQLKLNIESSGVETTSFAPSEPIEKGARRYSPQETIVAEAENGVPLPLVEVGVSRLDEMQEELKEINGVQDNYYEVQEQPKEDLELPIENPEKKLEDVQEAKPDVEDTISRVYHEDKDNTEDKEDSANSEIDSTYKNSLEVEEPFFSVSDSDFWDVNASSEEMAIPNIQEVAAAEEDLEVKVPNPDFAKPSETSDARSQTIQSSLSQEDVRDEISAVRDKYIIGRVVGEDIADSTGQVIIRKDQPITLSLMQMAQKEGKLADLIIHMVLPGQED